MATTNSAQKTLDLQPNQTLEVTATAGQHLTLAGATAIESVTTGKEGSLVINFANGSHLVIKNFADVASLNPAPTLTLADGKIVSLTEVATSYQPGAQNTQAADATLSPTLSAEGQTVAAKKTGEEVVINAPKAGEDVVVKLVDGKDYTFGFALNEPTAVKDNGGQLVITFKNGGEIIIPNYGTMKQAGIEITLKDGAQLPVTEFGDILAQASQLNSIEAAAGDAGGAGSAGRGFGFQSNFSATPLNSLNPIGVINPTQLQYQAPDRLPEPFYNTQPAVRPNLTVADSQVSEDGSVALNITAGANNSNEVVTITISGITTGWTVDTSVSGGTYNPGTGTWTITLPPGGSLSGGPILSPPKDSDVDLTNLTVTETVTNTVSGQTNTVTGTINVFVDAVADVPTISGSASGNEDAAIPLVIHTDPTDTDGSETITSIVISGVPAGATLSAGTHDPVTNTWTLTPTDLAGLTITPPKDFSGTIPLTIVTTATETNTSGVEYNPNDNTATNTTVVNVTVNAVADKPILEVQDAQVKEDGSVALNIHAETTDVDGSEALTITISGIGAGWGVDTSASGGNYANGTWTITLAPGQSFTGGPTLKPPANSDADLNGLVVTATSKEPNGSTAVTTGNINVIVDAVVDAPTLTVSAGAGVEDQPLALNIATNVTDTDGSETITKVVITGVPAGFTLSAGTYNAATQEWTLTKAQLANLKLNPPNNFNGSVQLTVTSFASESNLSGQEYDTSDNNTSISKTLNVNFGPGADTPTLTVQNEQVKEDGSVQLHIQAAPTDTSEHITITVTGILPGWGVNTSASGGTYANGTWTITLPAGQSFNGGPVVSPPANSDADMPNLQVTVTSTTADNSSSASTSGTISIVTDAVADAPTLVISNATGNEGQPVALNIATNVTDTDGSETISKVVITGVPAGFTLSAGTYNAATQEWTLTKAQLANLKLNAPANFNGDVQLTVTSYSSESNLSGGEYFYGDNTASITKTMDIHINPVADTPRLTVKDSQVSEDGSVALSIQASPTDSSEHITITVTGFAPGWGVNTSTSGGTYANGTWTITLAPGQTFNGGPTISPPANSDADSPNLTVSVVSTTPGGQSSAAVTGTIHVVTDAVIDTPTLTVSAGNGVEDTPVALNIATAVTDTDGSESITKVVISGVPAGFTLSAGTLISAGTYQLTTAQLANLKLNPPANFSGNVNLSVTTYASETTLSGGEFNLNNNDTSVTKALLVNIAAVADKPDLKVGDVWVKEDGSVALNVQASLNDTDGSERLTVTISGIGAGWTVNTAASGGTYANGTWTLTLPAGVTSFSGGPTLTPPHNSDKDLTGLVVTATSTETSNNSTASTTATTNVFVDAVADVPTFNVTPGAGGDATHIPLVFTTTVSDTDGSESWVSVKITDLPAGFTLSAGTYDAATATWTLTPAQAGNVSIVMPEGWVGNQIVTFTTTIRETNLSGAEQDYTDNEQSAVIQMQIRRDAPPDEPKLIVGTNVSDNDPSTTPYEVGTGHGDIKGAGAADILVGDVGGGVLINQQKDYNMLLILDNSGSMGSKSDPNSKISILIQSVKNLVSDFHDYTGGHVMVHFTPFNATASAGASFDVSTTAGYNAAINYLTNLPQTNGATNYESALQAGITWLQSTGTGAPIAGAETYTYFVSDGEPNRYVSSTNASATGSETESMNQIRGSDGTNEIAMIQSLSTEVIGVGINIGSKIVNINEIDSDGHALNVQNPNDLDAALQGSNPLNQLSNVGNDHLIGGAGDDILFGDSLNTDALAAAKGINVTPGSGWEVFERLEAGESASSPGWTRADTIAYIKLHATELAAETVNGAGNGRSGGHDTLEGGAGNDLIFGQEGNDLIIGGAGNDTLWGGSGADTFRINSVADGVDTIKDFSVSQGDKLDIHNILAGYDPMTQALSNFVKTVDTAEGTLVQVNVSGSGANFQTVAILEGVHIDLNTLHSQGNLIT